MKHLLRFVAPLVCALSALSAAQAATKPNILFIMTDDMNTDVGCYGEKQVRTPHIDALAKQGVLFEQAYCQTPLCSPSRSSIMMGRRPESTGVFINEQHMRAKLPRAETMPELFRHNGYFTARVGKIYHDVMVGGPRTMDDPASWDVAINTRGLDSDQYRNVINYTPKTGFGSALAWLDPEGEDAVFRDGMAATEAIHLLQRQAENQNSGKNKQPFFLAVGFYRPHVPNIAPRHYFDWYDANKLQMPDEPLSHRDLIPAAALYLKEPNYGLPDDKLRMYKRAYYATTSFVDAQVGRLMTALNDLHLDKNTIVVFVSDHGFMLGEHGQFQKFMLFEKALQVPLIIADPRNKANGQRSPRSVELLDIYPTMAQLAGLKAPATLEGRSLVPLLRNPRRKWKEQAFSTLKRGLFHQIVLKKAEHPTTTGISVRTGRWRYTEWNEGELGAELYDYKTDPQELVNLADKPSHAKTRTRLRAQLREYRKKTAANAKR